MLHQDLKIYTLGKPIKNSKGVVIMIHGRGGTAEDILSLGKEFNNPDYRFIAPQANGNSWYPFSFLAPVFQNEPGITSGINAIHELIEGIKGEGLLTEDIFLLGFSQGACLALEYAARNATRYAGIIGLSGGLIGPPGTTRDYSGSFEGTPVFLGCSDMDPHIPLERVRESERVFIRMKAKVTTKIYSGMPHTIIQDEIDFVSRMLKTG